MIDRQKVKDIKETITGIRKLLVLLEKKVNEDYNKKIEKLKAMRANEQPTRTK